MFSLNLITYIFIQTLCMQKYNCFLKTAPVFFLFSPVIIDVAASQGEQETIVYISDNGVTWQEYKQAVDDSLCGM